jgi:hypothetical protein
MSRRKQGKGVSIVGDRFLDLTRLKLTLHGISDSCQSLDLCVDLFKDELKESTVPGSAQEPRECRKEECGCPPVFDDWDRLHSTTPNPSAKVSHTQGCGHGAGPMSNFLLSPSSVYEK